MEEIKFKSVADKNAHRVIMLKAQIPHKHIRREFIRRFPSPITTEEGKRLYNTRVSDTLRYRCINLEMLENLEQWVEEINEEFKR